MKSIFMKWADFSSAYYERILEFWTENFKS
jgi:hypothetical protein